MSSSSSYNSRSTKIESANHRRSSNPGPIAQTITWPTSLHRPYHKSTRYPRLRPKRQLTIGQSPETGMSWRTVRSMNPRQPCGCSLYPCGVQEFVRLRDLECVARYHDPLAYSLDQVNMTLSNGLKSRRTRSDSSRALARANSEMCLSIYHLPPR